MPKIERTLIIFADPLERILSGRKTWEMRSRPTRLRERIGLSEKGANQIKGTAEITDCLGPLAFRTLQRHCRKAGFAPAEFRADLKYWQDECRKGKVYAWVLGKPRRLRPPVRFKNPSGAVVFAALPPAVQRRIS